MARVKYLDATNYEGEKILVFKQIPMDTIRHLKRLDPHFCDDGHVSPFARFEPTSKGWEAAVKMCRMLSVEMRAADEGA